MVTPIQKVCGPASDDPVRSLYIHVPFCVAKCRYCDFYSLPAGQNPADGFLQALAVEYRAKAELLARPIETIFVGGGTPTALDAAGLQTVLALPAELIGPETEFSVEANPGTLDAEKVAVLASAGVNRVNLGVQSFAATELATLGRIHNAAQAHQAYNKLRQKGLTNVGLDLIYGVPGQSLESWQMSMGEALALAPEHLSCYALTFEANTPLWSDLQRGRVEEMDEAVQEACWRHAIDSASAAGLEHYEISNFARPGRRCRHNVTYWKNLPYIGLGPGAASYVAGVRRTNEPDLAGYVAALHAGRDAPHVQERLEGRQAMAETVMLALRLTEGLNLEEFRSRYGRDVREVFPRSIAKHQETGWLAIRAEHLAIPEPAMFVSNEVLADILAEA